MSEIVSRRGESGKDRRNQSSKRKNEDYQKA